MPQIVEFNGQNIEFPDGMGAPEIEAVLKKNAMNLPASVSAGKAVNSGISDIPRQLGLTARYALEGPAQAAQIFTEPVAGLMRGVGIPTKSVGELASGAADWLGLPKPQGANERVIGDATRMMAGAGGMAGAANLGARAATGATQAVLSGLASNPGAQVSSAAGAGLLGGSSREAGGSPMLQAGAGLLGNMAGGLLPGVGAAAVNTGKRMMAPAMGTPDLDVKLSSIIERAGGDYSKFPENVRRSLRAELAGSLQAGKELDPAAVARLADFKAVGATPTRGMVSQNPVQITREMNLAKIAANSADDGLHGLPLLQNQNNQTLIQSLNNAGGASGVDALGAGRVINDKISGTYSGLKAAEKQAWEAAKNSPGYKQAIFPDGLNAAMREVGDEALTGYLPEPITDYMAAFQTGQQPFTPQHYKNLRSMLSGELAKGGNEAAAARSAIRGLDSVPMRPLTETGRDIGMAPVTSGMAAALRNSDAQPQSAIDAINQAREATAAQYRYAESSPLVKAALSGGRSADPEKIAQSFVINGTLKDAQSVAQEVGPQGIQTIRDALATHIKKQALSGASDETGKVSQAALNAALRKIGDEKLKLFFSPEEVAGLKATGRVATYMQNQPVGSAVNNSNSGALILGRGADMLGVWAKRFPFGQQAVADPLRNINIAISQRQAQNMLPGLLAEKPQEPIGRGLLLPALAFSGGLLSPP